MLKLRDSGFDRAILLVAGTKTNRRIIHEAGALLAANYPIATREALAALGHGEDPRGNCLVILWSPSFAYVIGATANERRVLREIDDPTGHQTIDGGHPRRIGVPSTQAREGADRRWR